MLALLLISITAAASSITATSITATANSKSQSQYLDRAEFLHGTIAADDREHVLSGGVTECSEGWTSVDLPDMWSYDDRYQCSFEGWYRFTLSGEPADEPWSFYLWRLSMNAEVYFNGELVGSGGSFKHPVGRNWNRPLLYALPGAAWRQDHNEILIRLTTFEGWGHLQPPIVGPTRELKAEYDRRFFWQITVNQIGFMLTCMTAFAAFIFWGVNRKDALYFWIAIAATGWSMFGLHQFATAIVLPPGLWWVIVHWSVDIFTAALCFSAHRLAGVRLVRFERLLGLFLGAALAYYASFRLFELGPQPGHFHFVSLMLSIYITAFLCRLAYRSRRRDVGFFAAGMVVMVLFGAQSFVLNAMLAPDLWRTQFYLVNYGAPVLLTLLLVNMAYRFANALRESEELNTQLEVRVDQITRELQQSYVEQKALEAERIATEERRRLFQDLHDDVGAKLLSLVYSSETDQQRRLAREALADVRSLASSQDSGGVALPALMADLHQETATRCELAEWLLNWPDGVPEIDLSSRSAFHLQRIVRELITNALKHSSGSFLSLDINVTDSRLELQVTDNGDVSDALLEQLRESAVRQGMGLRNISHRLGELGGTSNWHRADVNESGLTCSLQIPLTSVAT